MIRCKICNKCYKARSDSLYCKPCRKIVKNEGEKRRYRENAEYRERRNKGINEWKMRNKGRRSENLRIWRDNNRDKISQNQKAYAKRHPERIKLKTRKRNLKKFGLTIDKYEEMLRRQDGVCAICGKTEKSSRRLAVDHDHKSGKVRGLLCTRCNNMLGNSEDRVEILRKAVAYLNGQA